MAAAVLYAAPLQLWDWCRASVHANLPPGAAHACSCMFLPPVSQKLQQKKLVWKLLSGRETNDNNVATSLKSKHMSKQ